MSVDWAAAFAPRMAGMMASEIRELLKLIDQPDIISFAGGIPDPDLFPREAIAEAYRSVFESNDQWATALQYSVSEGYAPLRDWISGYHARNGAAVDAEEIVVTNGSQQGLDFLGKLLIGPGNPVAVSLPTYLGALQAFSPYQPRYLTVPMDADGIRPDLLEPVLAQRPKFLYLVPDFQNPNGITLSAERRAAVLDLCTRFAVPIIEDAAYTELRYDDAPVPSLLALDRARGAGGGGPEGSGIVIHAGTFSKTIAPALRIGWVTAPRAVIRKLVLIKQAGDLHCGTINQIVMHRVAEAAFAQQVSRIRPVYRARRDAMLQALADFFPASVRWTKPEGGMFVWLDCRRASMAPTCWNGRCARRASPSCPAPRSIPTGPAPIPAGSVSP